MFAAVQSSVAGIRWSVVENIPRVVAVARVHGVPVARIERLPRDGFRLTNCQTGGVRDFATIEAAQLAFAEERES